MTEPNALLASFLAEHTAADGECSCGWKVADYDLDREWGGPMSTTEAWCHHVRRASYKFFERHGTQYVEANGPNGETVAFTLERSTLLHDHAGWSLDHQRENREKYGYQYDGYEKPPADPDNCSTPMTCEEAGCRNPMCLGGHLSIRFQVPMEVCAGCRQPFKPDEERVAVAMQMPAGRPISDGDAVATTATYHSDCQPSDEDLEQRANELWPEPESPPLADNEPEQAMACLSCGLAGAVPEDHFPQEPGPWDRPCPQCGERMVWVTEVRA